MVTTNHGEQCNHQLDGDYWNHIVEEERDLGEAFMRNVEFLSPVVELKIKFPKLSLI
jgi:hypothetical protein